MRAFKVGPIELQNRLILAPMEDVSNRAMRLIAKRIANPALMFTEFVSAMAIHYGATKTFRKMRLLDEERPLGIQIFGADPEIMAETARIAESMGAQIVDINMGCWVPKVCKTGSGASLLKDPDAAEAIVSTVVRAVKVPITVKVRAGWDYSLFAAPELAKRFEGAGAQMITLHARFAKQGFEGEADWGLIGELKQAVTIPVLGNGDVRTPNEARRMLDETGCDGVMVGRAAISNPWLLRDIRLGLEGMPPGPAPSLRERIETALEHLRLLIAVEAEVSTFEEALDSPEFAGAELRASRALRGQIPMYIKGAPGASQARNRLTQCSSIMEYQQVLNEFASSVDCAHLGALSTAGTGPRGASDSLTPARIS